MIVFNSYILLWAAIVITHTGRERLLTHFQILYWTYTRARARHKPAALTINTGV
jgi:hypothetical protein